MLIAGIEPLLRNSTASRTIVVRVTMYFNSVRQLLSYTTDYGTPKPQISGIVT